MNCRRFAVLAGLSLVAVFLSAGGPPAVASQAGGRTAPTSASASASASRIGTDPTAPGDQLWAERYNGRADGDDEARAFGVSPDGSMVFVTGSSRDAHVVAPDYATVGYDAETGAKVWVARYNGPKHRSEPTALAVSPDGSTVFVTGSSLETSTKTVYATVAYDARDGARLWVARYKGPQSWGAATAMAVSPDGARLFVAGWTQVADSFDYATVAYDSTTGRRLWDEVYEGPAVLNDIAEDLAVSPDGSTVFVTGYSDGTAGGRTRSDYATVAYDAVTGSPLWESRYNGPDNLTDLGSLLAVSPDGLTVFVTGYVATKTRGLDYGTVAYDAATGDQLWATLYDGPNGGQDDPFALGVSPDGSMLYVTGYGTGDSGTYDYSTVAYDAATGDQLWAEQYDGPAQGYDTAVALGVSPDGSTLFVTGHSDGGASGIDYATVAYDAVTGARSWVRRYTGPGKAEDGGTALGLSPDGSTVFVAGKRSTTTTKGNFAVVAYSAD